MKTAFSMVVNGKPVSGETDSRKLLVEFLREDLQLTGTHVGCDTSQCGACTVLFNGKSIKSCTLFTVQAHGAEVLTIEGLAKGTSLHPIQTAFHEYHGLQCGFCTPGMVISALDLLRRHPEPSQDDIRHNIEGNLCRCTGYHNIVLAIEAAAKAIKLGAAPDSERNK